MKKILAMLAGALICVNGFARAPHWVALHADEEASFYVDANSIKRAGANGASVWWKISPTAKGAVRFGVGDAVVHGYAQCGAATFTEDAYTKYDTAGKVVFTNDTPETVSMPPGSIFEGMFELACETVQAKG